MGMLKRQTFAFMPNRSATQQTSINAHHDKVRKARQIHYGQVLLL